MTMTNCPASPLLLVLFFIYLCCPIIASSFRSLNEPCGEEALCESDLECGFQTENGERTCQKVATPPCSQAKCPVLFPDCPHDSVPVLLVTPTPPPPSASSCCVSSPVVCQCDPQKCIVPHCPAGTERVLVREGNPNQSGNCCDRFECRQSEMRCESVRCPDSTDTLDLYSPDGLSCPADSYRPPPYVPTDSCCPITSQCTCRLGVCKPARCGHGEKLVLRRKGRGEPGKCCDDFECVPADDWARGKCTHGGRTFAEGERWHAAACQDCRCSGGVALCRRMECPALTAGCAWVGLAPGDCCPSCLGCRDEHGNTHDLEEHWAKDDCTNCSCVDFRWQCQKFICKTECENPVYVPGQCCPVCDQPTIVKPPQPPEGCASQSTCPLRCELGLAENRQSGCFECECARGGRPSDVDEEGVKCEQLSAENCLKQCAHGYVQDQRGCALCQCAHCPRTHCDKRCLHGFVRNSLGCPICKCRPAAPASGQLLPHTNGTSSSALGCISAHTERDIGEWWTESGCWHCFCYQNKEYCSLVACPNRPDHCLEEHWFRLEGHCCPVCVPPPSHDGASSPSSLSPLPQQQHFSQVCHSPGTGQLFVDGETWRLGECLACTCRVGHVLCAWNDGKLCPPAPCEQPVFDPMQDKCCPRCPPNEQQTGESRNEQESCLDEHGKSQAALGEWRRDECHSCSCSQDGRVRCVRERCATQQGCASGRWLSLRGRCCPLCSDSLANTSSVCSYGGQLFAHGEQFQDGPCRNCTCLQAGILQCTEISCPSCQHANLDNNSECCPPCKESSSPPSALSNNVLYSFERGVEQIVLIGSQQSGWPWLLLLLVLAVVVCALSTLLAAVVCRRQKGAKAARMGGSANRGQWQGVGGQHTSLLTVVSEQ